MLGAVGGLFLVSFFAFICDLENQIWIEKRSLYFLKKLNC